MIARDDLIRAQEQRREQGAPLLAAELDRRAVEGRRQRAEEAENRLHRRGLSTIQGEFSVSSAPRETLPVWMQLEEWAIRGVFRPDA